MKTVIPIITIWLVMSHMFAFGQTNLDHFNFQIYYQTTSQDTAVFDSLCTRLCKITLENDMPDLDKIKVKIGLTEGGQDILQYDFAYDVTTGLPSGLSYYREDSIIYLGLHETYEADTYFYEVQLEDTSGNLSIAKKWN